MIFIYYWVIFIVEISVCRICIISKFLIKYMMIFIFIFRIVDESKIEI